MSIPAPTTHMPNNLKNKIYATAVGRRKEAVAQVRLIAGDGSIVVNGRPADRYFSSIIAKTRAPSPLSVLPKSKTYSVEAKIRGGGSTGQLDALTLGIARAISSLKAEYKSPLRKLGLLTRDSRVRQRRMVGMGGKSRRKKQSPKR